MAADSFGVGGEEQRGSVRALFAEFPYPCVPLERAILERDFDHYAYSVDSAFYRKSKSPRPDDVEVLDVGCGTGTKTLALACANPRSRVIGIDFAGPSIQSARERARHHGVTNVEFVELPLLEADRLGTRFDYVNCDDVLYLGKLRKLLRGSDFIPA
jgi:SAM-dependent methyltransferase